MAHPPAMLVTNTATAIIAKRGIITPHVSNLDFDLIIVFGPFH